MDEQAKQQQQKQQQCTEWNEKWISLNDFEI